jgi:hypothetical protein
VNLPLATFPSLAEEYISLSNECILVDYTEVGNIFIGNPVNGIIKLFKDIEKI